MVRLISLASGLTKREETKRRINESLSRDSQTYRVGATFVVVVVVLVEVEFCPRKARELCWRQMRES